MIVKSFEINKKKFENFRFFLLYGNNKGFIEEIIQNTLKPALPKNSYNYDENEILKNTESFKNEILNKSFFENKKLIIISRVTDKIFKIIEEIIDLNLDDVSIILKANVLEKKSKIRNFFEKKKETICIPFYEDNSQTLSMIANNFLREKNIQISQQNINIIVERCNGDRINLKNELEKISALSKTNKKINSEEIIKLTNLAENFSISDLVDSSLVKNKRRTLNIINENNFVNEDNILILRIYLTKLKRLLRILTDVEIKKDVDLVISTFKPPVFWKDKELIKKQIKIWSKKKVQNLIIKTNDLELKIKKYPSNSNNLITNFLLEQTEVNN
tara:strand:- start:104 stop:1096 length:993 start_codon:yes stop_codon:yes gene_type:complete